MCEDSPNTHSSKDDLIETESASTDISISTEHVPEGNHKSPVKLEQSEAEIRDDSVSDEPKDPDIKNVYTLVNFFNFLIHIFKTLVKSIYLVKNIYNFSLPDFVPLRRLHRPSKTKPSVRPKA